MNEKRARTTKKRPEKRAAGGDHKHVREAADAAQRTSKSGKSAKPPRRALGRGLDALLPTTTLSAGQAGGAKYGGDAVFLCPIEHIRPRDDQPRQQTDSTKLDELAASIREHGLIEPLVVRRLAPGHDRYEIIAGERRWRASQRAGRMDVLVVVKDVTPEHAFELALVENLQREDLNPLEVAEAYERLLDDHGYTQQKLAERMGKSRVAVTNALRLLKLPQAVRRMVSEGRLTEGHARALLGAPDPATMESIADQAIRGELSVRKVEQLVRAAKSKPEISDDAPEQDTSKSPGVRDLELRLTRRLGSKTTIKHAGPGGSLNVAYGSLDELDRILKIIGCSTG